MALHLLPLDRRNLSPDQFCVVLAFDFRRRTIEQAVQCLRATRQLDEVAPQCLGEYVEQAPGIAGCKYLATGFASFPRHARDQLIRTHRHGPHTLKTLFFLNDPHVAEEHGIAVPLQLDRTRLRRFLLSAAGRALDFLILMDEHAIVFHGRNGVFDFLAVRAELGRREIRVVGLPLQWREAHVELRLHA